MDSKELYRQARDAHSSKDYEKAGQIYKQIVSEHPTSDEAKASKGHLYYIRHGAEIDSRDLEPISKGVVIIDIQMPFSSMVSFMVKWVIATIPAFIILLILAFGFMSLFGGLLLWRT